jgi:hypothetical protein
MSGDLAAITTPHLEHGVDKEAKALLRGLPSGRGMRGDDQPQILEIGHHIAHRGRRQPDRQHARQIARTDGRAGLEIALDDLFEDVLAARIEQRQEVLGGFAHRFPSNLSCNHLGKNDGR